MAQVTERQSREPWRGLARSIVAQPRVHHAFDRLLRHRGGGRVHAGVAAASSGAMARRIRSSGRRGRTAPRPGVAAARRRGASPHSDLEPLDELARGLGHRAVTALATRGYLTNQLLRDIDAVSMAHSLEVRLPYLDPVVVDTALSLARLGEARRVSDADPYGRTYRDSERSVC
jgi:hypothetical protein